MADPTIQTLCCHRPNISDSSVEILLEFNSRPYNILCTVSSLIGIFGAVYQILPRETIKVSHRWYNASAFRGRQIIIWLASADLCATLGVLVRSILWLNLQTLEDNEGDDLDDTSTVLICSISSALIQYFYTATWMWTLCYAIDMRFVLQEKEGHPVYYHMLSWTLPAISTAFGLSLLYVPEADCHSLNSLESAVLHILPNYFATYIPIVVVMIANPIMYKYSSRDMRQWVTLKLNQFTNKEREILKTVKLRYFLINLVFYICWLPNLVNGILMWTLWFDLPSNIIIVLWYIMAVTNPLQALLNSLVYRKWGGTSDKLYIPCRRQVSVAEQPDDTTEESNENRSAEASENTPLLQNHEHDVTAARSINVLDSDDH